MEYPLILSGERAGSIEVHQEGLFTVFTARCGPLSRLLRISVYGGGKEGYLGIMQPWHGGLCLKRKFSRSQMKDFPEKIEYAGAAGLSSSAASPKLAERHQPQSAGRGLCWYRYSDGSLICRDGGSYIIALPASPGKYAKGTVLREIEGRLYMLFRY